MNIKGYTMDVEEKEVLKQCLEYLRLNNIYSWRNNTGMLQKGGRVIRFGFPGSSDILGVTPDGRFLAIECKRSSGGKTSEQQKEFIKNINDNGGVAFVANSLEALQKGLKDNKVL